MEPLLVPTTSREPVNAKLWCRSALRSVAKPTAVQAPNANSTTMTTIATANTIRRSADPPGRGRGDGAGAGAVGTDAGVVMVHRPIAGSFQSRLDDRNHASRRPSRWPDTRLRATPTRGPAGRPGGRGGAGEGAAAGGADVDDLAVRQVEQLGLL